MGVLCYNLASVWWVLESVLSSFAPKAVLMMPTWPSWRPSAWRKTRTAPAELSWWQPGLLMVGLVGHLNDFEWNHLEHTPGLLGVWFPTVNNKLTLHYFLCVMYLRPMMSATLVKCNEESSQLEEGLVEPAWLWESQSRMATPLGLEKYGRIDFSLGRWTSMGKNAPKLVLSHAKDQVELVRIFLRSLLRPQESLFWRSSFICCKKY